MNSILPFFAAPLLGAFIGYMTNYVAIRMLFKPLRPWRLFGIRLPLTPGVIPSKRHELAENIGEMVGSHLLTSKDVSRALTEEGFQNELLGLIEERVESLLEKDLGPIASLIPKRFRSYFEVSVKVLRLRFLEHLHSHIDGKQFTENLSATITSQLEEFLATPLENILPEEKQEHLYAFLEATTKNFLAGSSVQDWISAYINQTINDFLKNDGAINDLLPRDIKETFINKLQEETPNLLAKIAELLKDKQVQKNIAVAISKGISNFTSSMGPLVSLISNFINPHKIEQKVSDYLTENSDTLSQWLYDPAVQEKVAKVVKEKAEDILATPMSSWLENVDHEKLENGRQWIIDRVVASLQNPEVAQSLTRLLKEALKNQYRRPINDILTDLFGSDGTSQGVAWTTEEMISIIRSPKVKKMLDDLVTEMVEHRLLKQPVGKLSAFLPKEVQEGIADYLLQQVSDILIREVPGLVDSLNIKEIVAKKVDSLDLLRLEGLLLGIMQEQFKYINLFGGLLGFIIGLVNLVFLVGK